MSQADEEELHALEFYLRRNIQYHMRRAAFFTRWGRITSFVGVFFGSAAAITFLGGVDSIPRNTPTVMALIVAMLSAIDLVVGVGQRAALHCDLRRRYLDIQHKFQSYQSISTDHLRALNGEIRRIEAEEPPTMAALELMARNDVIASLYDQEELHKHYIPLPAWIRWTAHLINWDTSQAAPKPKAAVPGEIRDPAVTPALPSTR